MSASTKKLVSAFHVHPKSRAIGLLTKIRFVRITYPIISGISPNNLFAASLLYGIPGIGLGRILLYAQ